MVAFGPEIGQNGNLGVLGAWWDQVDASISTFAKKLKKSAEKKNIFPPPVIPYDVFVHGSVGIQTPFPDQSFQGPRANNAKRSL